MNRRELKEIIINKSNIDIEMLQLTEDFPIDFYVEESFSMFEFDTIDKEDITEIFFFGYQMAIQAISNNVKECIMIFNQEHTFLKSVINDELEKPSVKIMVNCVRLDKESLCQIK